MGEVLLLCRPHRCSPLVPPDGQVDTFVPKSIVSGRPETRHFQDLVIFRLPCRYACTPRTAVCDPAVGSGQAQPFRISREQGLRGRHASVVGGSTL